MKLRFVIRRVSRRDFVAAVLTLIVAGCSVKSGDAVVRSKEHVAGSPAASDSPAQPDRWIVQVEMISDLRKVNVEVEPTRWDAVKVGDRLKVSYSQGKYTGTIWGSELK